MRKIMQLILCAFFLFSCEEGEDIKKPQAPNPEPSTNGSYTGIMESFGTNLSGAEFSPPHFPGTMGTHYGYPTEKCLDYFHSKGLKLIRFPFRWERIQPTLYGALNDVDLIEMKKFVAAAEKKNMPVILDLHNFGRRYFGTEQKVIGSPELTIDHLSDVWVKLAAEFKSYKNIWGYDIMNEPYSMLLSTPWFAIAQAVINRIRTVDAETPIIISGDRYSSSFHWVQFSDDLRNLQDPSNKLIYQAHVYFDKDFSGQYKGTFQEEAATAQTGVDRVRPFVEWLKKYNKVGFIGEYGCPRDEPEYLPVLENMLKYLSDNRVPGTYWSAGPRWNESSPKTLSIQPTENYTKDKPQMAILEKYKETNPKK